MTADSVVFVTGTGTEIGKTWVAAGLARALRARGRTVAARKPLQSHDPDDGGPTDAEALAEATGQSAHDVCPPERTYPVPLAPPMAARKLGRKCPTLAELARACRFDSHTDVGIVEGVGGLYSPLASDGHSLSLIEQIEPDLVVVAAPAGLGAIHDTLACTLPLARWHTAVFLNRFDPHAEVHRLNLDWLQGRGRNRDRAPDPGLRVATHTEALADLVLPHLPDPNPSAGAATHTETSRGAADPD